MEGHIWVYINGLWGFNDSKKWVPPPSSATGDRRRVERAQSWRSGPTHLSDSRTNITQRPLAENPSKCPPFLQLCDMRRVSASLMPPDAHTSPDALHPPGRGSFGFWDPHYLDRDGLHMYTPSGSNRIYLWGRARGKLPRRRLCPDSSSRDSAARCIFVGANEVLVSHNGLELVILIRAKKGWTRRLWNVHREGSMPWVGVHFRTLIDGPFGSTARTRWGDYSSVLVVAGGSGVSYGDSILGYYCLCMSGRDGRYLAQGSAEVAWATGRMSYGLFENTVSSLVFSSSNILKCLVFLSAHTMVRDFASKMF